MTIKVLVVDGFPVVRKGLRAFLELDGELEVIAEACSGAEAIRLAGQLRPEVVLMEVRLPDMDGLEAIRFIRQELPDTRFLVLTGSTTPSDLAAALAAGASGYLSKMIESEELARAIKTAVMGGGWVIISEGAVPVLVKALGQTQPPAAGGSSLSSNRAAIAQVEPVLARLTKREGEVLKLVAQGKSNKEIGLSLGLREKTIKAHISTMLAKLNMVSRTQLAVYGAGWVKGEERV